MKIGDRCFVHGYIDEIRKDTVIIRNAGGYFGTVPSEVITGELPSAQPDIKQATKLLLDFIESCPGGDSYLITPDGEELRTDWGYATEGIQLIYEWAERRNDG